MNENKQMVTPNIEAKITWINPDPTSSKKANASVKIGGAFVIYGISIFQGEKKEEMKSITSSRSMFRIPDLFARNRSRFSMSSNVMFPIVRSDISYTSYYMVLILVSEGFTVPSIH